LSLVFVAGQEHCSIQSRYYSGFRIIRLASNYWLAFFCGRFTMGGAGRTQRL